MNRTTGKALTGLELIKQSIRDIITTPIGSRVMLKEYGCNIHEWIDAPLNEETKSEIVASIAQAITIWERRIVIDRIHSIRIVNQEIEFELEAYYQGESVTLGIAA